MDIQKIQENIRKNQEKLQKNEALLQKRIEKAVKLSQWLKENNINTLEDAVKKDGNTGYEIADKFYFVEAWLVSEPSYKDENNKFHYGNARFEFERDKIQKIKETIESWNEKLVKENLILNKIENLPESLKSMSEYLNQVWSEYELNRKRNLKQEYEKLGYKEFFKKYSCEAYNHTHKSDEEIRKEVETDVKFSILDLLNRVSEVAGEIEDWNNVRWLGKALNGTLKGSKNNVRVETIVAGGYNIQRLHYRVLVHKI